MPAIMTVWGHAGADISPHLSRLPLSAEKFRGSLLHFTMSDPNGYWAMTVHFTMTIPTSARDVV